MALMGAALYAALYYLVFGFGWRHKHQLATAASTEPSATPPEPGILTGRRTSLAMEQIARRIRFAVGSGIIKSTKVGENLVPSPIPTDEMAIRPIQDVSELPQALPQVLGMPDDMFFSQLAARELPVVEFQERVDVMADIEGVPRKALVLIVDTSGSMSEEERAEWASGLCEKAIRRADADNVEVALLPFVDHPKEWQRARTHEERMQLCANLRNILYPNGGTDIDAALNAGIEYLSDPTFTERKIMLVTDGGSNIDAPSMKAALKRIDAEMHSVCIGPDNPDLKSISAHYDWLPAQG